MKHIKQLAKKLKDPSYKLRSKGDIIIDSKPNKPTTNQQ